MSETTTAPATRTPTPAQTWPTDPVKYLLTRGWKPDGEPRHPGTRWLDPAKPETTREERIKVGERRETNGKVEAIYQTHVYPAAWPASLDDAVHEQMARDRRTSEAAPAPARTPAQAQESR